MTLKMASSSGEQLPGQVVLVLQGGGALGAYHGGVYQAMHEAALEPGWVIGTSIGAINGALIAGNQIDKRLERLREFWSRVEQSTPPVLSPLNGAFSPSLRPVHASRSAAWVTRLRS